MQIVSICMKCQILFPGKNKKNVKNVSPGELAQQVVKANFNFSVSGTLITNIQLLMYFSFAVLTWFALAIFYIITVIRKCWFTFSLLSVLLVTVLTISIGTDRVNSVKMLRLIGVYNHSSSRW